MNGRIWTDADLAQLRAEYPTCASTTELAQRMNRTARKLVEKACRIGVRREPAALWLVRSKLSLAAWASGTRKKATQPEHYKPRVIGARKPLEWSSAPDLVGVWR